MTERERLIELIKSGGKLAVEENHKYIKEFVKNHGRYNSKTDDNVSFEEIVADYLLSNGVIVLPCKIGDVVYVIDNKLPCYACTFCTDFCHTGCPFPDRLEEVVKKATIKKILFTHHKTIEILAEVPETDGILSYNLHYLSTDFDKTIFFSKEEAEKALKERGVND